MLFELEPSREVTGGAWYTGHEARRRIAFAFLPSHPIPPPVSPSPRRLPLCRPPPTSRHQYDSEFIAVLRGACLAHVRAARRGATLDQLCDHVRGTKLSRVDLGLEEVLCVVNTLVYDGVVDAHESGPHNGGAAAGFPDGTVFYTPAALPLAEGSHLTRVPCGVCPVAQDCTPGGAVSPETCVYFAAWLAGRAQGGGAPAGAGAEGAAKAAAAAPQPP